MSTLNQTNNLLTLKSQLDTKTIVLVEQLIVENNYDLIQKLIDNKLISYYKVLKLAITKCNIPLFISIVTAGDYTLSSKKAYNLFHNIQNCDFSSCTPNEILNMCDELYNALDINYEAILGDFAIKLKPEQFQIVYKAFTISPSLKSRLANIDPTNENCKWLANN